VRAVVLAASLAAACSHPGPTPGPRPYEPPDPEALIDALQRQASSVRSVRAEARVDHRGEAGRLKATILLIAQRPDRIRLDAMSPFGSPVASLATDGRTVGYFDRDAERFVRGPARACTLAWLVQLPLGPEAAVDMLLGGGAVIEVADASVSWDAATREEVLRIRGQDGGWQEVRLTGSPGKWRLRASEVHEAAGDLRYRVEHEEWRSMGGGLYLPRETRVTDGRRADVRIRYRRQEVNPQLPDSAFATGAPAGIPVEEADCE